MAQSISRGFCNDFRGYFASILVLACLGAIGQSPQLSAQSTTQFQVPTTITQPSLGAFVTQPPLLIGKAEVEVGLPGSPPPNTGPLDKKAVEQIIEDALKEKDAEKKKADEQKKLADDAKKAIEAEQKKAEERANDHGVPFMEHQLFPRAHESDPEYDNFLQSHLDSLSRGRDGKKWFDRLAIRGYTQIRFGRTLDTDFETPNMFADRTITGNRENFLIRRARLILFGDVTDHLSFYLQPDFGSNTDNAGNNTFFGQLRDLYADFYIDHDRVNRFRIGLSKVPYGWENLQSSQNRVPLDRTDPMNTAVAPNERDLGVFYYWTPVEKQKLFKALVDTGLKGSGNYGIVGLGVYNGQGGSQFERNLDLHMVARVTYPFEVWTDQFMEVSAQAYRGHYVVNGSDIRPLGRGSLVTPSGTGGNRGILDQRVAGTFVLYPQPFGLQAEWQYGRGPALSAIQTSVLSRILHGGYLMGMYRHETDKFGIWTPYVRWQQFTGGYRNIANAPYGHHRQLDLGLEWQLRKEFELVFEFSNINTPNFSARTGSGQTSFRDFEGSAFRVQCQFNY